MLLITKESIRKERKTFFLSFFVELSSFSSPIAPWRKRERGKERERKRERRRERERNKERKKEAKIILAMKNEHP